MVWFQCEDCGENLKKPKVPNHFRMCSATKLSCIDCGETFGQQSVQGHTQCITEAEKYGPKGQGKAATPTNNKTNGDAKQKPDVDINVGLSNRPPWFCSLCNTKATSQQALLLHAEGKKHRAKARAFHGAKQQAEKTEESAPTVQAIIENVPKDEEPKQGDQPTKVAPVNNGSDNSALQTSKKRKHDDNVSENGGSKKKVGVDNTSGEIGNGEVLQVERAEDEETECKTKKKANKEYGIKNIKWRKLITSALKTNPEGVLKMRELRKLLLKSLQEKGFTEEDEIEISNVLEQKIHTFSKFIVDGKYVRLVAKG